MCWMMMLDWILTLTAGAAQVEREAARSGQAANGGSA